MIHSQPKTPHRTILVIENLGVGLAIELIVQLTINGNHKYCDSLVTANIENILILTSD